MEFDSEIRLETLVRDLKNVCQLVRSVPLPLSQIAPCPRDSYFKRFISYFKK